MSNKKLKIGFIGGGINSTIGRIHQIACQLDSRWVLETGFFSRDKSTNLKTSKIYNVKLERIYNSFDIFLENEIKNIDAIAVLLPTPIRYKYLEILIKKKIPIISEKPLVSEVKDAIKLKTIMNSDDFIRVTYNYSGYPLVKELKHLIQKNFFGRIKQIHFEMPQDSFTFKTSKNIKPKKWRLKDSYIPHISNDLGSHLLSLTSFLIDEFPIEVMCNYFSNGKFNNLVDNGYFWIKFKSGINGTFWVSKSSPGIRNGLKLRIIGEKKSSEWLQTRPEELIIYNDDGSVERIDNLTFKLISHEKKYNRYKVGHPSGFLEAFANLYYDYADHLQSHMNNKKKRFSSNIYFDLNNSLNISKFFDAASKSNRLSEWVKIVY